MKALKYAVLALVAIGCAGCNGRDANTYTDSPRPLEEVHCSAIHPMSFRVDPREAMYACDTTTELRGSQMRGKVLRHGGKDSCTTPTKENPTCVK